MIGLIFALALIAIDGDTVRPAGGGESIRIENIDTPESGARAKCDAERFLAVHARKRLQGLLDSGKAEVQRSGRRDRYGRPLGRLSVNGQDVGRLLVDELLAVPWGGRRHDWCGPR